jgi:hypothetical protein
VQRTLGRSPAPVEVTQRFVALLDEDVRGIHRRPAEDGLVER